MVPSLLVLSLLKQEVYSPQGVLWDHMDLGQYITSRYGGLVVWATKVGGVVNK
jgi:hypothetical protein